MHCIAPMQVPNWFRSPAKGNLSYQHSSWTVGYDTTRVYPATTLSVVRPQMFWGNVTFLAYTRAGRRHHSLPCFVHPGRLDGGAFRNRLNLFISHEKIEEPSTDPLEHCVLLSVMVVAHYCARKHTIVPHFVCSSVRFSAVLITEYAMYTFKHSLKASCSNFHTISPSQTPRHHIESYTALETKVLNDAISVGLQWSPESAKVAGPTC